MCIEKLLQWKLLCVFVVVVACLLRVNIFLWVLWIRVCTRKTWLTSSRVQRKERKVIDWALFVVRFVSMGVDILLSLTFFRSSLLPFEFFKQPPEIFQHNKNKCIYHPMHLVWSFSCVSTIYFNNHNNVLSNLLTQMLKNHFQMCLIHKSLAKMKNIAAIYHHVALACALAVCALKYMMEIK